MGSSIWQYLWCIDKITKIDNNSVGWVLGGKPIKHMEISKLKSRKTISENLNHLKKEGYLILIRTPYGLKIGVTKAKKRFNEKVTSNVTKRLHLVAEKVTSNKTVSVDNINKTLLEGWFQEFWNSYPRGEGKKPALKVWLKINPSEKEFSEIMAALDRNKKTEQWEKDKGRFIPYAATWLNQERWKDEIKIKENKFK